MRAFGIKRPAFLRATATLRGLTPVWARGSLRQGGGPFSRPACVDERMNIAIATRSGARELEQSGGCSTVGIDDRRMSFSLAGKSVLVTGASAGIGRATTIALARAGASIIATGRRAPELATLARELGPQVIATPTGDLNDAGFVEELATAAREVDILVSNAGVLKYAPIMDMTDDECARMFETNVLASFRVMRKVAAAMVERRRGHIIVMSSIAAREVYGLGVLYCATKHALSALARGFRIELQGFGIKVTEIAPGMVETDIRASSDHPKVVAAIQARKFSGLTAEEVAEAVVYAAQAAPNCCPDLIELRPLGAA
jgi:NADP-dependent 3-hydroxy acid dehydrogenase YdfG